MRILFPFNYLNEKTVTALGERLRVLLQNDYTNVVLILDVLLSFKYGNYDYIVKTPGGVTVV